MRIIKNLQYVNLEEKLFNAQVCKILNNLNRQCLEK